MNNLPNPNNVEVKNQTVISNDHKRIEDDDCGLPADPVFADYPRDQWQGHSENKRMVRLSRASERNDERDQNK
jgi:hypothetical protein